MLSRSFKIAIAIYFLSLSLVTTTYAQDSLPNFSVNVKNGAIIIEWINPYNDIAQLIIQQSKDSIGGFRSVVTMPHPAAVTNGFAYRKPNSENYYYRIFYLRSGSRFQFTAPKKPTPEPYVPSPVIETKPAVETNPTPIKKEPEKAAILISSSDTTQKVVQQEKAKSIKHRTTDSVILTKKDTVKKVIAEKTVPEKQVQQKNNTETQTKTVEKKETEVKEDILNPSGFIFTNSEGNLVVALPDVHKKKFSLHVLTKDGEPLFDMKNIKEPLLQIDKSNFYKSGWFKYELYESGKLREKNKFFIPGDIK